MIDNTQNIITNDERFPNIDKRGSVQVNAKISQTRYFDGNDFKLLDAPDIDWDGAKMFYEFIRVTDDFPLPEGAQRYMYDEEHDKFIRVDESYVGVIYYNHEVEIKDTNTLLSVIEHLPKWISWENWDK